MYIIYLSIRFSNLAGVECQSLKAEKFHHTYDGYCDLFKVVVVPQNADKPAASSGTQVSDVGLAANAADSTGAAANDSPATGIDKN